MTGAPGLPVSRQPHLPSLTAPGQEEQCVTDTAAWARPVLGARRGLCGRERGRRGGLSLFTLQCLWGVEGANNSLPSPNQALLPPERSKAAPTIPPALGDPAAADRLHPWWFRKSQINSLPIMELIFIEGSLCAGRCVKCLASCRTPNTSMAWVPGSPALKKGESRAQRA